MIAVIIKRLFLQLLLPCYHAGHLAEGTYNCTSLETSQDEQPLQQIVDVEEKEEEELLDEDDDDAQRRTTEGLDQRNDGEDLDDIREVAPAQKSGL